MDQTVMNEGAGLAPALCFRGCCHDLVADLPHTAPDATSQQGREMRGFDRLGCVPVGIVEKVANSNRGTWNGASCFHGLMGRVLSTGMHPYPDPILNLPGNRPLPRASRQTEYAHVSSSQGH
jgi:hypothetical protein